MLQTLKGNEAKLIVAEDDNQIEDCALRKGRQVSIHREIRQVYFHIRYHNMQKKTDLRSPEVDTKTQHVFCASFYPMY